MLKLRMPVVAALGLAIAAFIGASADGCSVNNGPSGGSNNSAPSQAPAPKGSPTDCAYNIYDDACNKTSQPTAPVPSADARIPGKPACELTYDVPRLVPDGVRGMFVVRCSQVPALMLVTARLQTKNSAGNWVDQGQIYVYNFPNAQKPIIPDVPREHSWFAKCVTGTWTWRLEGHWNGVKNNGTIFPDPSTDDTPNDWASNEVTIKC